MKWPPFDNSDVEKRINGVLGPLTLFAPFSHEDIIYPEDLEPKAPEEKPDLGLERPVTPIDEEIKTQPLSFEKLAKYIRRRISPRSDVPHLSTDDQQMLAGILIGEVTDVWPEIRRQIDDPFLSPEENRELNRRISVHIVTVCEQLFLHYLQKAEVLNSRGIFSGPANMSRLKAQLALDADRFLNILTIRRYIVADMRNKDEEESLNSEELTSYRTSKPKTPPPKISYKGLIETSRPKSKTRRFRFQSPEQEARKITNEMPTLDTSKVLELISEMPDRAMVTPSQASEESRRQTPDTQGQSAGATREELSMQKVMLKRSNSVPDFDVAEAIKDEMGTTDYDKIDPLYQYELDLLKRESQRRQDKVMVVKSESPRPGTREFAASDLRKLIGHSQEEFKVEEDMPPLLQAITRNARHDGKKEVLEKKLKELEEKERQELEQQSIPLQAPTHPQPATVSTVLPNKMQVRASDVRVSERVCMSSITLERFATVYNDLTEEIDPPTVKQLDRNLFLGEEIKEVYQEIMRTVPTHHLDLDDDESVIPAADSVNLSGTMASASLTRRKQGRVINPAFLKENKRPPWGEMDMKQWVKTPNNPPKNFQGEDVFAPITPNMDKVHNVLRNPSKMSQLVTNDNLPSFVQDKMARTYASWLQWWKSTITSDDYMKYLSTQETDYMGVVFHFYDSDDGEDEDEPQGTGYPATSGMISYKPSMSRQTQSSKHTEQREKEKKIEEMKSQKNEYKEGFWNVNTVLLGGLGKDPVLEEEDEGSLKPPKSAETSRSVKTLQERAAARHSAKMEKSSRDMSQSRASKVTTLTGLSKGLDTDRSSLSETEAPLTPQDRLEKVWSSLEMPDGLKLDMAIKYSCNEFYIRLNEVIERWEKITDLILKREELLSKLEKFERSASDPNRFFQKGQKRSSVKRLKEAQQRSYYYKRIDQLDSEIKYELQYVKDNFRDIITYKGRPYQDKMKWDRIEMLHWLQEERKQNAMKYEAMLKHIPLKSAQLEPIPMMSSHA